MRCSLQVSRLWKCSRFRMRIEKIADRANVDGWTRQQRSGDRGCGRNRQRQSDRQTVRQTGTAYRSLYWRVESELWGGQVGGSLRVRARCVRGVRVCFSAQGARLGTCEPSGCAAQHLLEHLNIVLYWVKTVPTHRGSFPRRAELGSELLHTAGSSLSARLLSFAAPPAGLPCSSAAGAGRIFSAVPIHLRYSWAICFRGKVERRTQRRL